MSKMIDESAIESGIVESVKLLLNRDRANYSCMNLVCRILEKEQHRSEQDLSYILISLTMAQWKESKKPWKFNGFRETSYALAKLIEEYGDDDDIAYLQERAIIARETMKSRNNEEHTRHRSYNIRKTKDTPEPLREDWETGKLILPPIAPEAPSSSNNVLLECESEPEDESDWITVESETAQPA